MTTCSSAQALRWAKALFRTVAILSFVTGLGLAFLSFVRVRAPCGFRVFITWGGMIGTILGFLAFFLLPVLVRACVGETDDYATFSRWGWVVFAPLVVAVLWGLAWLIPYLLLKGDVNVSEYQAKDHIYKLPFPGGESSWVIQGNNSSFNHTQREPGSEILLGLPAPVRHAGASGTRRDNRNG